MAEERTLFEGQLTSPEHVARFSAAIEMLCAAAPSKYHAAALWHALTNAKKSFSTPSQAPRACHTYELYLPFLIRGTHFGLDQEPSALFSGILTLTVNAPNRRWDPPREFAALPAALGSDGGDACLKLTQIRFATRLQRAASETKGITLPTWRQLEIYFNTITGP